MTTQVSSAFRAVRALPLTWVLAACIVAALSSEPQTAVAPRLVAVGDIHGAADGLLQILRVAALVDDKGRWIGGTARLVQTGDYTDRGEHVRQVLDLLMRLEREARRAGGRVDVLFGNHEGMNVLRDLRDVSPTAYASFADRRSEDRRRDAFETHDEMAKRAGKTLARDAWMAARPAGFIEYVQAFGPDAQYGRWIRGRKTMLQVDDTIFMHAGLHPDQTASIEDVNRAVEHDVRTWDALVSVFERNRLVSPAYLLQDIIDVAQVEIGRIVVAQKSGEPLPEYVTQDYVKLLQHLQGIPKWTLIDADGPLWYRGLAQHGEDIQPALDALLSRLKAKRFVTGHTPQLSGHIGVRLGGRVILIDTGMLTSYYKGGQPSALEIQDGRLTAIYPTGRHPIDVTGSSQQ